jgi:hypothetical protein
MKEFIIVFDEFGNTTHFLEADCLPLLSLSIKLVCVGIPLIFFPIKCVAQCAPARCWVSQCPGFEPAFPPKRNIRACVRACLCEHACVDYSVQQPVQEVNKVSSLGWRAFAQVGVWTAATLDSALTYHVSAARIQIVNSYSLRSPSANIIAAGLLLDGCPIPGPGLASAASNGSTFAALFDPPVRFNGYYLVSGSGQAGTVEVSWEALPAPLLELQQAFGGANGSTWIISDVAVTWMQTGAGTARFDMRTLWPFWVMQNTRYLVISIGLLAGSAAGAAGYGRVGRHIATLTFLTLVFLDAAAALGYGPTGPIVAAPERHYWWLRNWANVPEHFVFVVGMVAFESRILTVLFVYGFVQVPPHHCTLCHTMPCRATPNNHTTKQASRTFLCNVIQLGHSFMSTLWPRHILLLHAFT